MSQVLPTDATAAGDIAAYDRPLSPEPMSWRAAGIVILGLSAAGWLGVVMALDRLIG